MAKVIRREFMGSRIFVTLMAITGIFLPLAVIEIIENTITIEEETDNPGAVIAKARGTFKVG